MAPFDCPNSNPFSPRSNALTSSPQPTHTHFILLLLKIFHLLIDDRNATVEEL